jgi:predicted O-methyltransferase YrrM
VIGETGTGYGVGLAWLLTGAHPGARLVSIDRDQDRATISAGLFADDPRALASPVAGKAYRAAVRAGRRLAARLRVGLGEAFIFTRRR